MMNAAGLVGIEGVMLLRGPVVAFALCLASCSHTTPTEGTGRATSALAGAPTISSPIVIPASGRQSVGPSVWSAGPSGYLLLSSLTMTVNSVSVFGARVGLDGSVLDPAGITLGVVPTANDGSSSAAAVYTGAHWLVVFNGLVFTIENDGTVNAPTPLPSNIAPVSGLAWGNDRALLLTIGGQGVFLDGNGSTLGSAFSLVGDHVVFNGSVFFVTREGASPATEVLQTVTNAGIADSVTYYTPGSSRGIAQAPTTVVSAGSSVLITYMASGPTCVGFGNCTTLVGYDQIAGAGSDGHISLGPSWQGLQLATAFGGRYLLWTTGQSEWRDSSGTVVSGPASANLTKNLTLIPAYDSSQFLALTLPSGSAERLDPSLNLLDPSPFAPLSRPFDAQNPSVAFDGSDYLVAFESTIKNNANQAIGAARVTAAGSLVDSTLLSVTTQPSILPFAASNGHGFLIDWQGGGGGSMAMASIDATAAVAAVDLGPGSRFTPTLTTDGVSYLATWSPPNTSGPVPRQAALVSAAGIQSGPIDFGLGDPMPTSGFDGANYVLAWNVAAGSTCSVYAARLSPALEPIDTTPLPLFTYSCDGGISTTPVLASDGERTLIVWTDDNLTTVRCARIERDLTLTDPGGVVVGSSAFVGSRTSVAWDGSAYWIAWSESASGQGAANSYRLVARRMGPDLGPLDTQPFTVTDDGYWPRITDTPSFALKSGPPGQLLVAYNADDRVQGRAFTIRARLLGTAVQGSAGASGSGTAGSSAGAVGAGGSSAGDSSLGGAGAGGVPAGGASGGELSAGSGGETGGAETAGAAGAADETGGTSTTGTAGTAATTTAGTGGTSESGTGGTGGSSAAGSAGTGALTSTGGTGMGGALTSTGGTGPSTGGSAGSRESGGHAGNGAAGRGGRSSTAGASNAGATEGEPSPPSGSGCGCAVPSSHAGSNGWLALAPLLLGAIRRRVARRGRSAVLSP